MSHLSSPWHYVVPSLQFAYGDDGLAEATGFFWECGERVFLVSNWHCFAGIDPDDGAILDSKGRMPNHVIVKTFQSKGSSDDGDFTRLSQVSLRIPLHTSLTESPRWLEHHQFGKLVDVAALDVTSELRDAGIHFNTAVAVETDAFAPPEVAQDVLVLGYPLGPIDGMPFLIWKRGSIASDPSFDAYALPKIYVDTATRPGMSGSLVLVRQTSTSGYNRRDGTREEGSLFPRWDQILGIYSGALGADHVEAQLGVVWKRSAIEELVLEGVNPKLLR